MLQFTDQYLTCTRCGDVFLFAAGAQAFCTSRGFTTQPNLCPPCRSAPRLSPRRLKDEAIEGHIEEVLRPTRDPR